MIPYAANRQSQPIRNSVREPTPRTLNSYWTTNVGVDTAIIDIDATGGRFGGQAMRVTAVKAASLNYQIWASGGGTAPLIPVTPGQMWSISAFLRTSVAGLSIYPIWRWRDSNNSQVSLVTGALHQSDTSYTRVSGTAKAPAGAAYLHVSFNVVFTAASQVSWLDGCMAVQSDTTPDFGDGNTPGWRWTGTPGQSESVGYPYTLESFAGKPWADLSGAGNIPLDDSKSLEGLTIYTAFEKLTALAAWEGLSVTGAATIFSIGLSGATSNVMHMRLDSPDGVFNATSSSAAVIGKYVFAHTLSDGITARRLYRNGTLVFGPQAVTPGTGLVRSTFNMAGPSVNWTPYRSLLYRGEHNPQTVAQISAWLARQYGLPIPDGY